MSVHTQANALASLATARITCIQRAHTSRVTLTFREMTTRWPASMACANATEQRAGVKHVRSSSSVISYVQASKRASNIHVARRKKEEGRPQMTKAEFINPTCSMAASAPPRSNMRGKTIASVRSIAISTATPNVRLWFVSPGVGVYANDVSGCTSRCGDSLLPTAAPRRWTWVGDGSSPTPLTHMPLFFVVLDTCMPGRDARRPSGCCCCCCCCCCRCRAVGV